MPIADQPRSIEQVCDRLRGFVERFNTVTLLIALGGISLKLSWIDLGGLAFLTALILLVRIAARPKTDPIPFPPRAQFTVLRERRLSESLQAIKGSPAGVLILSGHSGVGKTVLTKALVNALIKSSSDLKVVERNNYGLVQADALQGEVRGIPSDQKTLFVLDQLEKVFLLDPPSANHQLACLSMLISACLSNSSWSCILVVRREWFLNLTTFDELRPLLGEVHVVGGFDPKYEQPAYQAFRNQLIDLLAGNAPLVDAIINDTRRLARTDLLYTAPRLNHGEDADNVHSTQVIPVQALAAIDALRFLREHHGQEHSIARYEKMGRLRGVMRLYFSSFLDASGRPGDAARVLAALSVDPRSRRSLSDNAISSTTSLPLRRTRELLEFFTNAHLLQRVERRYDWIHDFFAESFNDLSGSFLNPAERDNISNFWERIGNGVREGEPQRGLDEDVKGCILSLWLFGFSVVILWSRALMLPLVSSLSGSWWASAMLLPVDFLPAKIVDFSFLPVSLSLTAWSWYTTTLFRRLFCRLDEPRLSRLFSYTVAVMSTLLVCLSVVFPRWWVALTGAGGFLVGLKYIQVGRRMGEGWKRQERFFGRAGFFTSLNSLFTFAAGVIYAQVVTGAFGQLSSEMAAALSFASMVIMLYFAYQVSSLHLDSNRVPLLVGIYRRYSTI